MADSLGFESIAISDHEQCRQRKTHPPGHAFPQVMQAGQPIFGVDTGLQASGCSSSICCPVSAPFVHVRIMIVTSLTCQPCLSCDVIAQFSNRCADCRMWLAQTICSHKNIRRNRTPVAEQPFMPPSVCIAWHRVHKGCTAASLRFTPVRTVQYFSACNREHRPGQFERAQALPSEVGATPKSIRMLWPS